MTRRSIDEQQQQVVDDIAQLLNKVGAPRFPAVNCCRWIPGTLRANCRIRWMLAGDKLQANLLRIQDLHGARRSIICMNGWCSILQSWFDRIRQWVSRRLDLWILLRPSCAQVYPSLLLAYG